MLQTTLKAEVTEQLTNTQEQLNMLQNQMKAQRYEIEGNILKKIKTKASEEERKMEDFYKFKADVYQYLDSKYENMQSVYSNKFKTLFEFNDRADDKLRVLWDQKSTNELKLDDFLTRHQQKLQSLEDNQTEHALKYTHLESKIKESNSYILRLKKVI